jgi:hypothetical protein
VLLHSFRDRPLLTTAVPRKLSDDDEAKEAQQEAHRRAEVRAVTRNDSAAIAVHGADATAAVWCLWWAAGVGLLAAAYQILLEIKVRIRVVTACLWWCMMTLLDLP